MDLVSLILSEPSFSSSAGTSGLEEGPWDFESEKKKKSSSFISSNNLLRVLQKLLF